MESQHPREVNVPVNTSPAADAPWSATVFPTVVRDDAYPTMDTVGNHRQGETRENVPPPAENTAAWGQSQDPQYDDMGYYVMTYDYTLPHGHRDYGVADYAGVAQDDLTEAQVNPPAHDINTFNDAGQRAAASHPQATLDEWLHQDTILNGPAAEYLQRIAIHYLHQPNSQVSLIHMEPSHAGGVKVVITLEMADF